MTQSVQIATARFTKWCRLGGTPLTRMGRLVEEQLLPPYLALGFQRVSVHLRDPKDVVSARQICLERFYGDEIDTVIFNFDKYRRPTFQVHLSRREIVSPHAWVRAANLVRKPSQYLHFWGKPWWLPTRYWTEQMSANTIECVLEMTARALAFLERSERCRNISKSVNA
ncbi:hypothetical protein Q4610_06605 [Sphingobium sp. HBC34]|uniref:Uncharacterized protein n=1 Tax=Sphingobium cyanobacteriorum TaxID=3063954 RepID=A0ABT8ZKR5_9SPHN|nr:hypothetical protein [Sphingobium sp. HBC34]MDO7834713.1 hypothetical protein [Sphingobium sp. HBC34]